MAKVVVIPPFRFEMVEDRLFRSAYPTVRNLGFLKRLQLRTIVSLIPDAPTPELATFCEENDIMHVHVRVKKFKSTVNIDEEAMASIIETIVCVDRLPLLVHCLNGGEVTGTVMMCLRKLQNWNLSSMLSEYSRFASPDRESEFVESFDAAIHIPQNTASWLFNGQLFRRHPTMSRLVFGDKSRPSTGFRSSDGGDDTEQPVSVRAELLLRSDGDGALSLFKMHSRGLQVSQLVYALDVPEGACAAVELPTTEKRPRSAGGHT